MKNLKGLKINESTVTVLGNEALGNEMVEAVATDASGKEYFVYWNVKNDSCEDGADLADWDNPIDIVEKED